MSDPIPRFCIPLLALVFIASIAMAAPRGESVFGPQTFEVTSDPSVSFEESFTADEAGNAVLHVRNGDDEASRVDEVTITLNGATVVSPGDLDADSAGLAAPIQLEAGTNHLEIGLSGVAGSFVTVAISPPGSHPRFVSGRLLLPWGRNDDGRSLALALKNGSPRFPRVARVIFYGPGGSVAGASEKIALPPHASLAIPVDDLIDFGHWSVGSIEVIYTGPGVGRLFGTARQLDRPLGLEVESLPLAEAGFRVYRGIPERDPAVPYRRRQF